MVKILKINTYEPLALLIQNFFYFGPYGNNIEFNDKLLESSDKFVSWLVSSI